VIELVGQLRGQGNRMGEDDEDERKTRMGDIS